MLLKLFIKLRCLSGEFNLVYIRVVKTAGCQPDSEADQRQDLEAHLLRCDSQEENQRQREHKNVGKVGKDVSTVNHLVSSELRIGKSVDYCKVRNLNASPAYVKYSR